MGAQLRLAKGAAVARARKCHCSQSYKANLARIRDFVKRRKEKVNGHEQYFLYNRMRIHNTEAKGNFHTSFSEVAVTGASVDPVVGQYPHPSWIFHEYLKHWWLHNLSARR
jgi:hypothetical protein